MAVIAEPVMETVTDRLGEIPLPLNLIRFGAILMQGTCRGLKIF